MPSVNDFGEVSPLVFKQGKEGKMNFAGRTESSELDNQTIIQINFESSELATSVKNHDRQTV